jgi:hypothetical protein
MITINRLLTAKDKKKLSSHYATSAMIDKAITNELSFHDIHSPNTLRIFSQDATSPNQRIIAIIVYCY